MAMSGELVLMGHVARLHYLQGLWTATSFPDRDLLRSLSRR